MCIRDRVWHGHLQMEVGFWSRWKTRYVTIFKMQRSEHLPSEGARHLILCVFDRPVTASGWGSEKIENFIVLSAFSNAKTSWDADGKDMMYVHLIPRAFGIDKEVRVAMLRTPPNQEVDQENIVELESCLLEGMGEHQEVSSVRRYFDRDIYFSFEDSSEVVRQLTMIKPFIQEYMCSFSAPKEHSSADVEMDTWKGSNMRDYVEAHLSNLLNRKSVIMLEEDTGSLSLPASVVEKHNSAARACLVLAKSITGLLARMSLMLFSSLQPPEDIDAQKKTIKVFPEPMWRVVQTLRLYQIRQLMEEAVFTASLPGYLSGRGKAHVKEFLVVWKNGVGYRKTMRFDHRCHTKLGPVGNTSIWGQRRTGFDGVQYVETPDGYLPMTDPSGENIILQEVLDLSEQLEEDLARVALEAGKSVPVDLEGGLGEGCWIASLKDWMKEVMAQHPGRNPQELYEAKWPAFSEGKHLWKEINEHWGKNLRKYHPGKYEDVHSMGIILQPALDMVQAMSTCSTPVQMVRLWSEAVLQAKELIEAMLPADKALGGDDCPSLAFFLVTLAETAGLVGQVELAKLFAVSDFDEMDFGLHPEGLYEGIQNQYLFRAEQRNMEPNNTFLWVQDTLSIICHDISRGSTFDPDPDSRRASLRSSTADDPSRRLASSIGHSVLNARHVNKFHTIIRARQQARHDRASDPGAQAEAPVARRRVSCSSMDLGNDSPKLEPQTSRSMSPRPRAYSESPSPTSNFRIPRTP
eukprot:TRINITY_DN16314_c0_g1_i1.p1 TRINITY_DN16314_c0_g1~~TRINITY_DN16314_c0_g1_i1.p1  ORF type:complete len:747 (+),score=142.60 TRINITY_DN16314_c0_g1_i1:94-2334(+)